MGVKKVSTQEVIDQLEEAGQMTVDQLAKVYSVCSATIRSRLRELRQDGAPIFFDENGLYLIYNMEDNENAAAFEKYTKWVMRTLIGVAKCGKPSKTVMLEYKKQLKELMTREERQLLTSHMTVITRMLDYIQIDEDMEE